MQSVVVEANNPLNSLTLLNQNLTQDIWCEEVSLVPNQSDATLPESSMVEVPNSRESQDDSEEAE
jgi:hypothetical protein